MNSDQPNPATPPATGPAAYTPPSGEVPLVRFASRMLLGLNLVLAAFFCLVLVPMIQMHMPFLPLPFGPPIPKATEVILSIPPQAYWANAIGLAGLLLLLEFLGKSRKTKLICNAAATVFLVTVLLVATAGILFPFVGFPFFIH